MLKLLKYELMRKKKIYIIFISIILVLTTLAAIGYNFTDNNYWIAIIVISVLVTLVGCSLFPLLINVINYYGDFKNRNGYMMFMTPNSGYKIFGSKILAVAIDTILALLLISIFATVSYLVLNTMYSQEIQGVLDVITKALSRDMPGLTIGGILALGAGAGIIQSMDSIILAMLAITVSKTLLSQKSFSWFIPLLIFIAMSIVEQTAMVMILGAINFKDITAIITESEIMLNISLVVGVALGLYLVFTTIYTVIASTLLNKKIDL